MRRQLLQLLPQFMQVLCRQPPPVWVPDTFCNTGLLDVLIASAT